jgi:hypothetical protein
LEEKEEKNDPDYKIEKSCKSMLLEERYSWEWMSDLERECTNDGSNRDKRKTGIVIYNL